MVIHTREADDDTRAILANHSSSLKRKGVIHSFTSSLPWPNSALAKVHAGLQWHHNVSQCRQCQSRGRATPVERIVLETDAPYLTPVPYRGRPNAPCYLPFIAETLAEIKSLPTEALLEHARANSYRLFF